MNSTSGAHIQDNFITEKWWQGFLLLSGFSAVIYQMVWQRILFTTVGETLFTRTAVVSLFLFGLALGAVLGGELSHRFADKLPKVFFILQLTLGSFGLISYPLVRSVGTFLASVSYSALPFFLFFLLLIPTLVIGALLPPLVRYVHQRKGDVGGVLSRFHGFFLLGMALGTVLLVFIIYFLFNLIVALIFASLLNFGVAFLLHHKIAMKPLFGRVLK